MWAFARLIHSPKLHSDGIIMTRKSNASNSFTEGVQAIETISGIRNCAREHVINTHSHISIQEKLEKNDMNLNQIVSYCCINGRT